MKRLSFPCITAFAPSLKINCMYVCMYIYIHTHTYNIYYIFYSSLYSGTFHAKMGTIKDRNNMDLKEAEKIKKRWQEYTEELYKKDVMTQITTMV